MSRNRFAITTHRRWASLVGAQLVLIAAVARAAVGAGTVIQIRDDVVVQGVKRLGLNVGVNESYAAAEFRKNLIDNPGFESGLYGTVFHAAEGATGIQVPQDFWDTTWDSDASGIGFPAGFWTGANYEVLYGPAKGRNGTVSAFTLENDLNTYHLDADGVAPQQWDVLDVRGPAPSTVDAMADPSMVRPGGFGAQSLHLTPQMYAWQSSYTAYMDSALSGPVGKFYVVKGPMRIQFWAKGRNGGERLRATFSRTGEAVFFDQTFTLTSQWQQITSDFFVPDGEDPPGTYPTTHPNLMFQFFVVDAGTDLWVDDLYLGRSDQTATSYFCDDFVNRLREYRPGVLRDWAVQFGDILANELATPFARKMHGFSPKKRVADLQNYSLPEFLELCEVVGADPWYVIPPTFTGAELQGLMAYLAAPVESGDPNALLRSTLGQPIPWTSVFQTIHLEFGNELWGAADGSDPFFGASVLGGTRLGSIAQDRLGILKSSPYYNSTKFNLIVGGQFGAPDTQSQIEAQCWNHNQIALSPYFGDLDQYATDQDVFGPLFARPFDDVNGGLMTQSRAAIDSYGQGTALAVYEINFNTPDNAVPIDTFNDFVTSAAGAVALPLYMLTYLHDMGIKYQCAFTAVQYSFTMPNGVTTLLWGMMRDLENVGRKRPTWLGVELANHAVMGDMITSQTTGNNPTWHQDAFNGVSQPVDVPLVQSFAFRNGLDYSLVVFNLDLTASHAVTLSLPHTPYGGATMYQIAPNSLYDNNENEELVSIATRTLNDFADSYLLVLPPHSVSALTWSCGKMPLENPSVIIGLALVLGVMRLRRGQA